MHGDAMNMERSTLERKDRAELAAVAEALGIKVPSRAKKADIISLILDGVSGFGPAEESNDGTADAGPTGADASEDHGADARRPEVDSAEDRSAAEAEVSTGSSTSEAESAPAEAAATATGSRARGGASSAGAGRPSIPAPPTLASNGSDSDADHESAAGEGEDEAGHAEDRSEAGEHGDGEGEGSSRSRRRRRRGRDRVEGEGANQGAEADAEPTEVSGLLDLREDGYGFLRVNGFLPGRDDVYVSVKQCRQLGLRKGDHLTGLARPAGHKEKNPALVRVETVNGLDPEAARSRPRFEELTPLFPDEKLTLEGGTVVGDMTGRIIDLVAPIGKGQRGLIVSPPKAGKTTIMKTIAQAIERNHPDVHLIVLLIDERPEEVTDFRRSLKSGDVVASTFDRPADEHTAVAELTIEHAKRLVEYGNDVVVILDGITRLARAYNLAAPAGGRAMSGGLDSTALYPPKKFFGAARNAEEGGSLTILATALVETGSVMDTVIFEEFKGTGNMELRLDRYAAEKRLFPAIDVDASSTRHEELLFERKQVTHVHKLRRVLGGVSSEGNSTAALEMLVDRMGQFRSNDEFLTEVAKAPSA